MIYYWPIVRQYFWTMSIIWTVAGCDPFNILCQSIWICIILHLFKLLFWGHFFYSFFIFFFTFINDRKWFDSNKFIGLRLYDFCNIDIDLFLLSSIASFQVWIKYFTTLVCFIYCFFFLYCSLFGTWKSCDDFNQCAWCILMLFPFLTREKNPFPPFPFSD